jgi:hypothetical protein
MPDKFSGLVKGEDLIAVNDIPANEVFENIGTA